VLEDGARFGHQVLEDGEVVFAEMETATPEVQRDMAEIQPASYATDFGDAADITKKAQAIAKSLPKMKDTHRADMVAALDAEAQRLRDGVLSAEAWQQANPDALSQRAAIFQRFLDSHSAKSIRGGLEKLLSPDVQARL